MLRSSFRNSFLQEQITLHINQTFLRESVCPFSPLFLWRHRNSSNWSSSGYRFKSLHLPTAITGWFFFFPCTSNRKWVGDLSYCCVITACKFNLFIATTVAFKIENKYDASVKIICLSLPKRNYKTGSIRIQVCFPSFSVCSEEN